MAHMVVSDVDTSSSPSNPQDMSAVPLSDVRVIIPVLSSATANTRVRKPSKRPGRKILDYEDHATTTTVLDSVHETQVELSHFGTINMVMGIHPKCPLYWSLAVQIMMGLCTAMCIYNIGWQTRAYRGPLFDSALAWWHVTVQVTWYVIRRLTRLPEWRYLVEDCVKTRATSQIFLRHQQFINAFFWSACVFAILAIYVGWTVPIFLSIINPSADERVFRVFFFLVFHGFALLILIPAWVFACIGVVCYFSILNVVCVTRMFNLIKYVNRAYTKARRVRRSGTPGGTPGGSRRCTPAAVVSVAATVAGASSITAKSSMSSKRPTPIHVESPNSVFSNSEGIGAESKTAATTTTVSYGIHESGDDSDSDSPVEEIQYSSVDIDGVKADISKSHDHILFVSQFVSLPLIMWYTSSILLIAASVRHFLSQEDGSASVSRWAGSEGAESDFYFRLAQDLVFFVVGVAVLLSAPFSSARISYWCERFVTEFVCMPRNVKHMSLSDMTAHVSVSIFVQAMKPGYYCSVYRITPEVALVTEVVALFVIAQIV